MKALETDSGIVGNKAARDEGALLLRNNTTENISKAVGNGLGNGFVEDIAQTKRSVV